MHVHLAQRYARPLQSCLIERLRPKQQRELSWRLDGQPVCRTLCRSVLPFLTVAAPMLEPRLTAAIRLFLPVLTSAGSADVGLAHTRCRPTTRPSSSAHGRWRPALRHPLAQRSPAWAGRHWRHCRRLSGCTPRRPQHLCAPGGPGRSWHVMSPDMVTADSTHSLLMSRKARPAGFIRAHPSVCLAPAKLTDLPRICRIHLEAARPRTPNLGLT
jgi:hypothetical protein